MVQHAVHTGAVHKLSPEKKLANISSRASANGWSELFFLVLSLHTQKREEENRATEIKRIERNKPPGAGERESEKQKSLAQR